MTIASWSPQLSLGVEALDEDHQRLIDTMNDVFDGLLQGTSASATRPALAKLRRYVEEHFAREEAWILENASANFEQHQVEHQALRPQILVLMSPSVGTSYIPNPLSFFKKDQIEVKLHKYSFTPDETIKGTVGLKLKKPLQAKKLTVALIGLRTVHQGHIAVGPVRVGNQGQQTQVYTIYHFEIPLDGEDVYFHEFYPFEIQIPPDILQSAQQNFNTTLTGLGKTIAEIAQVMNQLSMAGSRVEWSVEARLIVPLKIDVVNSQKIVLCEQQ